MYYTDSGFVKFYLVEGRGIEPLGIGLQRSYPAPAPPISDRRHRILPDKLTFNNDKHRLNSYFARLRGQD